MSNFTHGSDVVTTPSLSVPAASVSIIAFRVFCYYFISYLGKHYSGKRHKMLKNKLQFEFQIGSFNKCMKPWIMTMDSDKYIFCDNETNVLKVARNLV